MPRAGLNRERVVHAAGAIADELGLERLTMAAVAEHFGVALPSLYKHVGGLDDLRRELRILGLRQLAAELSQASVGKARGDALAGIADSYRAYAHRHPGVYAGTARAPEPDDQDHTRAAAELLQIVFSVLAGYGIEGDDAIDATRFLHAALHGYVSLEDGGSFKMARNVDHSFQRLIDALDVAFANWAADAAVTPGH
ncbi:MAG TPA: WHG domain-containing protein [Acidimicrobiales bacterium]|nr:WHG domain-containing protein [Acidimicrobiales bacterium]